VGTFGSGRPARPGPTAPVSPDAVPGVLDAARLAEAAAAWYRRRTYLAGDLPDPTRLAERKRRSGERVSVVLPALDEAATIGSICRTIRRALMEDVPLVDELLVVDGDSRDGTAHLARAAGATVHRVGDLVPEVPAVAGKGEALWRSLAAAQGDLVVWLDADIANFAPHFVSRLLAPLLLDPTVSFVKGFYRRPLRRGATLVPDEGGRVTELLARPLLAALFPELAGFAQPLAGEYAGRRATLERVPFFTGYSVEVGLLVDLAAAEGLDALAQVDLGVRVHRNRPLAELAPMARAIARTILRRAEERGRLLAGLDLETAPFLSPTPDGVEALGVAEVERPPMARLRAGP
jgi:glucosyl-3-phosphoglycerate synthase